MHVRCCQSALKLAATALFPAIVLTVNLAKLARADFIHPTLAERSGTIMEFAIDEDKISLILEIDRNDEDAFAEILSQPSPAVENNFLQSANGEALTGVVRTIEQRERTQRSPADTQPPVNAFGQPIPLPDISPTVTYVEIEYPLDSHPDRITLLPPMEEGENRVAASIGFVVFHQQLPLTSYWYLSGPEALNLDWEDPWYSQFENRNLTRPHPSSLASYLYVEPYEVRHEITIRIADLLDWIELDIGDRETLTADNLADIEAQAADLFATRLSTEIDGMTVEPIVDRAQFLQVDRRGIFQPVQAPEDMNASSGILGLSLAFITDDIPQEVSVEWDLFNERIQSIPVQMTDPAGPYPYTLTPNDNVLVWKNFLTSYAIPQVEYLPVDRSWSVPIGSIVLVGLAIAFFARSRKTGEQTQSRYRKYLIPTCLSVAALVIYPFARVRIQQPSFAIARMSEEESRAVFEHLLRNIYRAFDFRDESDVYDKLAISLDGDLLTEVYLQTRKSMELENEGGAVATVEDVELLDVQSLPGARGEEGFAFETAWIASGTVVHWGHAHNRRNRYNAILTLAPFDNVWKISNIELLDEERL